MTPETLVGAIVAISLALGIVSRLWPKPRPKDMHFRCARCNARAAHTERTIEAWRQKKTKFFCQACHRQWLESQSDQRRYVGARGTYGGRSGCLGVLVLLVFLPTALIAGLAVLAVL
jgi:hypothetical protein